MAQSSDYTPIKVYASETAGNLPAAVNLEVGELAINIADGAIYTKDSSDNIVSLGIGGGIITEAPDSDTVINNVVDDNNSLTQSTIQNLIDTSLEASLRPGVETVADTGYTLSASVESYVLLFTAGTEITVTVPSNSNVVLPVGYIVHLHQAGEGQVVLATQGGVSVTSALATKTRVRYSSISLIKTGTDTWVLIGDQAQT
jgi:hypothetical protein